MHCTQTQLRQADSLLIGRCSRERRTLSTAAVAREPGGVDATREYAQDTGESEERAARLGQLDTDETAQVRLGSMSMSCARVS
ncbi:MAG: hypothetical protein RL701_4491 [Pseudomonadota bacterium]